MSTPTAGAPAPVPPHGRPHVGLDVPVLVFAPGSGRSAQNSAARVAELVARAASIGPGSYDARESKETVGPGLRAARTIVGPDGEPVLDVLELDYLSRIEDADLTRAAPMVPGFVRSGMLAVRGIVMLAGAVRREGVGPRGRLQLAWGFACVAALLVGAVVATLSALAAMGVVDTAATQARATAVAVGAGVSVTAVWAAARTRLLGSEQRIERFMRFADMPRYRATIVRTVWEALDSLRDQRRTGPIHLVGFSLGSLVLLDALFPREDEAPGTRERRRRSAAATRATAATPSAARPGPADEVDEELRELAGLVRSLTTIGCPADFARMYWPGWFEHRRAWIDPQRWLNVRNESDVFGSAFDRSPWPLRPRRTVCYQPRRRWWTVLLMRDFSVHGEYWGTVTEDSCFQRAEVRRTWLGPRVDADGRVGAATPAPHDGEVVPHP